MSNHQPALAPLSERLVLAGIEDISTHGVRNFSMRRVATVCNVSCATPYKHFADREAFFAAIIEYINRTWADIQTGVAAAYPGQLRRQLVEIAAAYVRFLVEHPHFRSIIMMDDDAFDTRYASLRGRMSQFTQDLLRQYCPSVGMNAETELRKTFVVRSLIYGAALMFGNGQLPLTEENFLVVKQLIDREFDLP